MIFKKVVLPAPLGPNKPKISPRSTVNETFCNATCRCLKIKPCEYVLLRSLVSIAGPVAVIVLTLKVLVDVAIPDRDDIKS